MSNKKSACDTATATSTKEKSTTSIISSAKEKINSLTLKKFKNPKYKAILEPVKKMLTEFSEQQEEFARAVADVKDLEKLINDVGRALPNAVSDLDVYQQVVEKIFPGAKVTFSMQIHMSEYELEEQPAEVTETPTAPKTHNNLHLLFYHY